MLVFVRGLYNCANAMNGVIGFISPYERDIMYRSSHRSSSSALESENPSSEIAAVGARASDDIALVLLVDFGCYVCSVLLGVKSVAMYTHSMCAHDADFAFMFSVL